MHAAKRPNSTKIKSAKTFLKAFPRKFIPSKYTRYTVYTVYMWVCVFVLDRWLPSYDAHIHLLGYPFLDSKDEFTHNTVVCDVMRPHRGDPPLTVIDLSIVTIGSLRTTIEESEFFGFPCVLNADSQLLAGFLSRKDIQFVLGEAS